MSDVTKEVKILGTADFSQAKAETEQMNAALGETAVASEAAAEAEAAAGAAVAEMSELASVGGKKYALAIDAAGSAVARLEIAVAAVRVQGGPVSAADLANLEKYDAAVAAAALGTEKMSGSTLGLNTAAGLARGNVGGLGSTLAKLSEAAGPALGAVAKLGLAGLILGESIKIVIGLAEAVGKAWDAATNKIASWTSGMSNATRILDEHGKAVDPMSDKYQTLADKAAEVERAEYAISQAFITATDNMAKNLAAVELHKAALHGWSLETAEALKALKEFGIKLPPTFDEMKQHSDAFFDAYTAATAKGKDYAYSFLEANKTALAAIEKEYANAGREIPDSLTKLGDAVGVYSETAIKHTEELAKKQAEALDATKKKFVELGAQLKVNEQEYTEHAAKVEATRQKEVAAIEQQTQTTIADLQKQVTETEAAHAARSISDSEYNTKINALIAAEAKAKADGYEKEVKINDDTAKSEKDLADKFVLEQAKVRDEREKNLEKQKAEQDAADKLNIVLNAQLTAFSNLTPKLFDTGAAFEKLSDQVTKHAASTYKAATDMHFFSEEGAAAAVMLGGPLGLAVVSMTGEFDQLAAAAKRAAEAIKSVTE